jgi:sugar/nucleoside kinase (ribokinase family)
MNMKVAKQPITDQFFLLVFFLKISVQCVKIYLICGDYCFKIEKMNKVHIAEKELIYSAMVGVGGIGAGSFFLLNGNHTLGREESRSGRFIDRSDYCKLHIVSHYVKAILGNTFSVILVGRVGDDETGRFLYEEMRERGLVMDYVEKASGEKSLFSFCFIYPDGSGGNLTTDDSACARVDSKYVSRAKPLFYEFKEKGVALAVPEVGLDARRRLLELGSDHAFFRVASFSSAEITDECAKRLFSMIDLLALNIDEAARAAGIENRDARTEDVVSESLKILSRVNSSMMITITAGAKGSWVWDAERADYKPAVRIEALSTAGAGDAFLAGVIAGICAGLPLFSAHELGVLSGAYSVTSPHTIHKGLNRENLSEFSRTVSYRLSEGLKRLLR